MYADVKNEWLRRLRSRYNKQIQGRLRNNGKGRCCLGVLCDIHKSMTNNGKWRYGAYGDGVANIDDIEPPQYVLTWAKIPHRTVDKLINMNDGNGGREYSFEEIADYIEKNLKAEERPNATSK